MAVYSNISEIKNAISSHKNDTVRRKLKKRWEADFDLYRLQPYSAGAGYYSYTSNAPRVLADHVIAMLVQSRMSIRYPIDNLTEKERTIANNMERYNYGCINMNNERLRRIGCPTLVDQMSWYLTVRGGYAERIYVYKNDAGETDPNIAVWDLYNTYYNEGSNGLLWAANVRMVNRKQAEKDYGDVFPGAGESVEVIDFWDDENNGIIVGDKFVKPMTPHNIGYCPVFLVRAGATPTLWQENYNYTATHIGESVFAANRGIYPMANKMLSDLLTIVRRGVKTPMGYWSAAGDKTIEEDIYQVDKAAVVPFRQGEEFKELVKPTMPGETAPLLEWFNSEEQRGGLSHIVLGQLGFRLSGYAIQQLKEAVQTVINPFISALEYGVSVCTEQLTGQYADSSLPAIKIRGRTSRDEVFGMPKKFELSPSDIEKDWSAEVTFEPTLPSDEAQKYQIANMARMGDIPLLSMQTIREKLLGVEDTDMEDRLVSNEWTDNLPMVRLMKMLESAYAEQDFAKAAMVIAEIQRLVLAMAMEQKAKMQPQMPSDLEAASMGAPGAGVPSGETGMTSNVMPPEVMGGMPGGAMTAGGVR